MLLPVQAGDSQSSNNSGVLHQHLTRSNPQRSSVLTSFDLPRQQVREFAAPSPPPRDPYRDIPVKIHVRRPERDQWTYMGRGIVTQEGVGEPGQMPIRSASSRKILITWGAESAVQPERRGNFVVIGCVEGSRVVSWSLNTQNSSETLRLLASIELACSPRKHSPTESQSAFRRRVHRVIKDDRKRRHKRRKDQDAMVAAFARTALESAPPEQPMSSAHVVTLQ
ncbi:uncharacterized protein LAESUDRAFT_654940 [Laetiporus sulphureus 93-53]|uniref:Uncharacterized protein n=1 Tax=Laetiporus sulphureus 93-53 TaxID=1314785 RepID=A0A165E0K1_9APHY|nr:uncharacterized protein LAESUDRAFT_654940 [Laetiporus sulphureus 93-53]KZT06013.1 hypothetical protein LAESUDRAFT_654940 [Laetiporus sulphureus 93-53]